MGKNLQINNFKIAIWQSHGATPIFLCEVVVIKSSTTLRSNLFITGQYDTEEYGTIAGVI